MIREEICTYEVAKLANEKGFPQEIEIGTYWTTTKYYKNSYIGEYFDGDEERVETMEDEIAAIHLIENDGVGIVVPTHSELQRWLREEKGYYVYPFFDNEELKWTYVVREKTGDMWIPLIGETAYYDCFDESMEDALKFVLENFM